MRNYLGAITTAAFGFSVFLFWLLGYPEALNYQEQNQLFLTTGEYIMERMAVPGGLADYFSEFLVQFYYVPWLGALLIGMLYAAMQWLMWMNIKSLDKTLFQLTFLLPIMILWHQGDIDALLSLPVAILLSISATVVMSRAGKYSHITDIVTIPVIYWTAGPAAIIYVAIRGIQCGWRLLIEDVVLLSISILAAYWAVDYQYPLSMMITGINYYRIPLITPAMQHVVVLTPIAIAMVARINLWKNENTFKGKRRYFYLASQVSAVVITGICAINKGFDPFIYEILWQDSMVRQERWHDIIHRAEKHQYDNDMSCNCVNLALGMTGQLADRMFTFKQSGEGALLLHMIRDNMSDLPTAEAFWRLGMVNSAKRYMMDIQQSILNARQSGRCTKRIAECHIVNGDYKAAEKRLNILKNTIFYKAWAEEAETYLYNDAKVNNHETWGKLRSYRFKDSFLYNYPEKFKMLGLLFQQNIDNKLALSYFMGQLLLDGNINGFMGYMQWVQQYGGYSQMPSGYADACQAIQQNGNVPNSAYAKYVNNMMQKRNR